MSEIVFSSWSGQVVDNRSGHIASATIPVPLGYDNEAIAAFISWDGVVIADPNINIVALANAYMQEAAQLACGECNMGYKGMSVISETLARMAGGQGKVETSHFLRNWRMVSKRTPPAIIALTLSLRCSMH